MTTWPSGWKGTGPSMARASSKRSTKPSAWALPSSKNAPTAAPEVSRTRPLPLGRRLAGGIDNVGEVLAIAEGEDYR